MIRSAAQWLDFILKQTTRVNSQWHAVSCPTQPCRPAVLSTVVALPVVSPNLALQKACDLKFSLMGYQWFLNHASPVNNVTCDTCSLLPLLSLLLSFSMGRSSMGCYINEDRRKLKMCWETHRSKVTGYFMCMLMSWMLRTLLTDDVKYLVLPAVQDASSILSTCLDFIVWLLPTKSIPMKVSHWSADSSSSLAHLSREPGLSQWFYLSSCTFLSSGVCAAELEIIFCISRQMEKP